MRIAKYTIKPPPGKVAGDVITMIGQWGFDQDKLRRSLKTLAVAAPDDAPLRIADEHMLQTLGTLTLVWAVMERALDDVVGLAFGSDPDRAIQSTLPVTLDNKLDYLRKARAALPWLAPYIEPMRVLQSRIKLARIHRKNVTHGVLSISPRDYEAWTAKVLTFDGAASAESDVSYDPKEVFETILEIDRIGLDLQTLRGDLRTALDAA